MGKKVFIIGNGFDLDLGMNTRYSDFALSEKWPFHNIPYGNLARFLQDKVRADKWFDLEKELLHYAQLKGKEKHELMDFEKRTLTDKVFFMTLIQALIIYISGEETKDLKENSVAAKVLKAIIKNGMFSNIYSFNYTNLYQIAYKLGINEHFDYEHVHGSIKESNIILGVEDKSDLIPGYQFLYKTYSPYYESHPIQYDMLEAEEVVFFGHSLGHNDYHYFKTFFQEQCRDGMKRKDGKRITIFTYDDSSRIEILEQLRHMNEKKTDLLFNLNQMQFICTKNGGGKRFNRFVERMEKENKSLGNYIVNELF